MVVSEEGEVVVQEGEWCVCGSLRNNRHVLEYIICLTYLYIVVHVG